MSAAVLLDLREFAAPVKHDLHSLLVLASWRRTSARRPVDDCFKGRKVFSLRLYSPKLGLQSFLATVIAVSNPQGIESVLLLLGFSRTRLETAY